MNFFLVLELILIPLLLIVILFGAVRNLIPIRIQGVNTVSRKRPTINSSLIYEVCSKK